MSKIVLLMERYSIHPFKCICFIVYKAMVEEEKEKLLD